MGVNGIYGLSGSGIDVESMVKVGMMSKQSEYNKMQQQYTKDQWQKQAYNEIYGNLQTFNNSTLTQYKLQSNMNAKNASTTSSAITVSANGAAPILNHKIQVNELSSAAYLVSTNKLTRYFADGNTTTTDQTSINLADVLFKGLQTNTSSGKKMANIHEVDDYSSGTNLRNLTDTAFELQISADGKKYSTIKYTYKQLIDGRTFNDLVSDINGLNINVRAGYDTVNDTFNFYNKEGGSENGVYFKVKTNSSNEVTAEAAKRTQAFLENLHLFQSNDGKLIGENGETVTDTSKNYFGYETTYTSAAVVASNSLVDRFGNDAIGTSRMMDLIVGDYTYDSVQQETTDENGNTTTEFVYKYLFNNFDDDDSDSSDYQHIAGGEESAISFNISANGESYDFNYTFDDLDEYNMTLDDILKDITDRTGLNATVSDEGYLSIYTDEAGSSQSFSITANDENGLTASFFNRLGLYQGNDSSKTTLDFSDGATVTAKGTGNADAEDKGYFIGAVGTSGSATIDGVTYDDITDNKITAAGVTYTLLEKTEEPVTVNVVQDTSSIIDKVKSFVEDYNNMLSSLYEKYNEKPHSDYKPLTDSQRDQMTDDQIEKWEEKAKSGMLYHDQTLQKVIYKIRDSMSTSVSSLSGKYDSVFSLGIKTTGLEGKLTLDEDKLKKALEEDPDSVYNIFGTIGKNDTFDENGVAQRLGDILNDGLKLIRTRAGTDDSVNDDSDLGQLMRNLQTRMSDFKKLLDSFEDKLYKKYDAMEVALSQLGVQLNYVTWGQ